MKIGLLETGNPPGDLAETHGSYSAMFEALIATCGKLQNHKGLRAVVISGEGRAFCAGLDMGRFASMKEGDTGGTAQRDLLARTYGQANAAQQILLPGVLDVFVAEVVPLLQKRGLFRTAYEGTTLRDHFGLPRPAQAPDETPAALPLSANARKALGQFDHHGRLVRWPNKYSVQALAMWVLWPVGP